MLAVIVIILCIVFAPILIPVAFVLLCVAIIVGIPAVVLAVIIDAIKRSRGNENYSEKSLFSRFTDSWLGWLTLPTIIIKLRKIMEERNVSKIQKK